uniref:Serpentine receptor class gamma n=1 Tax=Acrobeloides nanus TaxID=290746 RepID=A0A914E403_9BILA
MPIMLPNYLGYYGMIYSNALMLIERIIATVRYKNYEDMNIWIGILLCLAHFVISSITTYVNFVIPYLNKTITYSNLRVVVISTYNLQILEDTNFTLIAGKTILSNVTKTIRIGFVFPEKSLNH